MTLPHLYLHTDAFILSSLFFFIPTHPPHIHILASLIFLSKQNLYSNFMTEKQKDKITDML